MDVERGSTKHKRQSSKARVYENATTDRWEGAQDDTAFSRPQSRSSRRSRFRRARRSQSFSPEDEMDVENGLQLTKSVTVEYPFSLSLSLGAPHAYYD